MSDILFRHLARLILALVLAVAVSTAPARAADALTYTVRAGDTVGLIAQWFGVTPAALLGANGMTNARIVPGQVLQLPAVMAPMAPVLVASEPPAGRYSVQTGDTLFFIGRRFGDSVAALQSANGLASTVIYPGQSLVVPSRGAASASVIALAAAPTTTYTVKRGDTLYFIARRYGTTWQALMAANGISDPRRLMPGQVLVIAGVGYAAELVSAAALPTAAIGEPLTGVYCGSGIAMTLDDRPAPDRGGRCTCVYAYGAHTAQRGGDLVDSTQQGLAPAQAAAAEVPQSNVFCGNGVYYFDYSAVTGYVNERFAPNTFWR